MKRYIQSAVKNINDEDSVVKLLTASNPKTSVAMLLDLSKSSDTNVRAEVAYNPNTPTDLLVKMSEDPSENVRVCVAQNQHTPEHILRKLMGDSDWLTRQEALKTLYKDKKFLE